MVVCYFLSPVSVLINPMLLDFGVRLSVHLFSSSLWQPNSSFYRWLVLGERSLSFPSGTKCMLHNTYNFDHQSPIPLLRGRRFCFYSSPRSNKSFSASWYETVCCLFPSGVSLLVCRKVGSRKTGRAWSLSPPCHPLVSYHFMYPGTTKYNFLQYFFNLVRNLPCENKVKCC